MTPDPFSDIMRFGQLASFPTIVRWIVKKKMRSTRYRNWKTAVPRGLTAWLGSRAYFCETTYTLKPNTRCGLARSSTQSTKSSRLKCPASRRANPSRRTRRTSFALQIGWTIPDHDILSN